MRSAGRRFRRAFPALSDRSLQLANTHMGVFLLPNVEGGTGDPELPTDVGRGVPLSTWRKAYAICSAVTFDFFIGPHSLLRGPHRVRILKFDLLALPKEGHTLGDAVQQLL